MAQDVGADGDDDRARTAALGGRAGAARRPARRALDAERALDAGDHDAGMALATALGEWSDLGGYELEGRWDAACRQIVRDGFADLADLPCDLLSGGERKRLVLHLLFASDAGVLLLDEPDNFLDVPAKRWLEELVTASRKTVLLISHDRTLLAAASRSVITLEGSGAWVHGGSYATLSRGARGAPAPHG